MSHFFRPSAKALILLSALTLLGGRVLAQELDDEFTALEAAAQREDAERKRAENRVNYLGEADFSFSAGLRRAARYDGTEEIERALAQVSSRYKSPAVVESLAKLRAALKGRQQKREEEIEAALASARHAIEDAKSPADLDASLAALDKAAERAQPDAPGYRPDGAQKLRAAREVTAYWQDFLSNLASGATQRAIQNLENVSSRQFDLLPRSIVLGRIASLRPAAEPPGMTDEDRTQRITAAVAAAGTPDEIPKALALLDSIPRRQPSSYDDFQNTVRNELLRIQDLYADFKLGLPVTLSTRPDASGFARSSPELIRLTRPLRMQLLRLAAPRFLRVKEEIGTDETLDAYLNRMTDTALDRVDARMLSRLVELRAKLGESSTSSTMPPALQALLAGQNQEEAAQYLPAVVSYQRALSTGGELVPAKIIGARLEVIKAAHPQEYEAGVKLALSSPAPAGERYQGYNVNGPFQIAVPGAATSPPP